MWIMTALRTESVSKRFDGVNAVVDATVDCTAHEIVGLIGPNGAGKTTLLGLIAGQHAPDNGSVHIGEHQIDGLPVQTRARMGIARTFQSTRLFGTLTVGENLAVSRANKRRDASDEVPLDAISDLLDIQRVMDQKAETLSYGTQRRVELARALAQNPLYLLLDEPAAGLDEQESAALGEALRRVQELCGVGMLVIDHDMTFVMSLCARVYVLSNGEVITHGPPAQVQGDDRVIEVYMGRKARGRDVTQAARSRGRAHESRHNGD